MTESGFHVGDLISYNSSSRGTRYARVVAPPSGWSEYHQYPWGFWADTQEDADRRYRSRSREDGAGSQYCRRTITLIERFDGPAVGTEGSTGMSITFNGETIDTTQAVGEVVAGTEYRIIYPRSHHNFEFIGRARESVSRGRSGMFEITQWVRANNGYGPDGYAIGYVFSSTSDRENGTDPACLWLPVTPPEAATVQDEAHDGQKGIFEPHNGSAPESGTIVRGMVPGLTRQVEGLFLRLNDDGTATIERKRKRVKRADGRFTEWETYSNVGRVSIAVEGAEVFKPGGSKPAETVLTRGEPITNPRTSAEVKVGDIFSGKVQYGSDREVFRGEVVRVFSTHGEYVINATEQARLADARQATGVYDWKPIDPREMQIYANWSDGDRGYDRAGYVWTKLEPGVKPVDPAFDPKRKTPFTGMGIGDVVVGLMKERDGSRDTVSSWVKGEIVKWNVRYGRPIVKVTDKMESTKQPDAEVELVPEDTYPAMADPAATSPEEYKKTLRLYLIGRHKRGDFCRGGLNTMLAAHGIPLYETRRRAKLVVQVDYDPNVTDLYSVQQDLRSKMAGVSGLSFAERSGEDIELALESDRTQD